MRLEMFEKGTGSWTPKHPQGPLLVKSSAPVPDELETLFVKTVW